MQDGCDDGDDDDDHGDSNDDDNNGNGHDDDDDEDIECDVNGGDDDDDDGEACHDDGNPTMEMNMMLIDGEDGTGDDADVEKCDFSHLSNMRKMRKQKTGPAHV